MAGTPRQRFLLTGTYQLPFGPGREWSSKSKFVNAALGGWNVSTVTLLQTGPWLTPTISTTADQSNTGIISRGGITARPDVVGNPASGLSPGLQWNINAFAPTPANAGRIGNAAVGILEGPGTISVSAGLSKTFAIRERLRFRFESTFYERAESHELRSAGHRRQQSRNLWCVAIGADCGRPPFLKPFTSTSSNMPW